MQLTSSLHVQSLGEDGVCQVLSASVATQVLHVAGVKSTRAQELSGLTTKFA